MGNQLQVVNANGVCTVFDVQGHDKKVLKSFDNEKDALQFARKYDSHNMNKEYIITIKS